MITPDKRRLRIRELLSRNQVHTQEQLQALLEAEGVRTTQTTISRDLRELAVRKSPAGYELPPDSAPASPGRRQAVASLKGVVTGAERGGTVVVLHTRPGLAPAAAATLNGAGLHEVLGAVAGADTVLVATQTSAQARSLLRLVLDSTKPG